MATLGSMLNMRAVCALATAMSASWAGSGFGVTAQSANSSTRSARLIRKAPETVFMPGSVLMTCRAGRMVLAVVWLAPDTRPSAPPM